jgi:hypothetical protein
MLIDERIQELTEGGAKQLLRKAVEEIAGRLSCDMCAMHTVCGRDATDDDCMRQVLVMLAVPGADEEEDAEEDPEKGVIYYDKDTMQIEE